MEPNRITKAIANIEDKIAEMDQAKLPNLEAAASLSDSDWLLLGDKSTLAYATGKVTLDEANVLHGIHTDWTTATLAQRIVFIQAMQESMS